MFLYIRPCAKIASQYKGTYKFLKRTTIKAGLSLFSCYPAWWFMLNLCLNCNESQPMCACKRFTYMKKSVLLLVVNLSFQIFLLYHKQNSEYSIDFTILSVKDHPLLIERIPFRLHGTFPEKTLRIHICFFMYVVQCLTFFTSMDHRVLVWGRFLMLFPLT